MRTVYVSNFDSLSITLLKVPRLNHFRQSFFMLLLSSFLTVVFIFFLICQKHWIGQVMGREKFYGDHQTELRLNRENHKL